MDFGGDIMTFRIVERLTHKIENLFGIHSPSRMFSAPPEDINAIPEMAPCPQCGEVPMMSYCCGEYFIFNNFKENNTCFCAGFTEMHSSKKSEVEAWNKTVSKYEAGKRNDC